MRRAATPRRTPIALLLVLGSAACNGGDRELTSLSGGATAGPTEGSNGTGGETADTGDAEASDSAPGSTGGGPGTAGPTTGAPQTDGTSAGSSGTETNAATDSAETSTTDASTGGSEGGSESSGGLADGVLDITITSHNDCTFSTSPASITVPEGTEFTVNWVSSATSEVEFDVAKIDSFNAVPIILGMEPGTSYHDEVRQWCGDEFTGTFDFRVTSCFDHHYIPVDCGG